ncbi:dolichyl-diphosphooligosaccharide--protein glycosyltransferase subunit dad1 [Anaeramoeba flamelloides]|uniref:Dolichyl-diphosphooligosaccharide--protein glycosyltransferase subunit OST2 n=1 Tax=Anaeramoeba flamelloides TaxID=1746091 RepID=A0AAV7Z8G4_9EUKA|nr:dolichyl-diphosphooligosaccharide--protein glycosyltransferase subunit dad1 [Anaeramoeba flamelloides]KAJ3438028.1 dolichyl-diphosphooligosaccharide--protein glycosyltransferase subunit dad1 [Anaeramoeba flamelloides]KAJ6240743.1 dolichyl-diphosphooligosaccharide--protein glycosyltransferase subunit dad1 [Anaeramoeba flamelloides]KAJ6240746.1 dolichyl-diphosphooligosaccharide--protein glycosyltransferase subunit dad1 [Anaeramoeba flamelloides]
MTENSFKVFKRIFDGYKNSATQSLKIIDCFLLFQFLTGIFQFVYVFLVGKFPFNSFLAGFISTVGSFVLTINLRTLVDPENKETKVSIKRAFVDFLICNVILHLAVFNYIG